MSQLIRALVIVFTVAIAACAQKTAEDYRNATERYLREDDLQAAVVSLKEGITEHPEAADLRWLLAGIYMSAGDFASAEKELQVALEKGHPATDIVPVLAQVRVQIRQYDAVLALSPVDGMPPESLAVFFAAQSLAATASGDSRRGELLLAEAQSLAPDDIYVQLAEARQALSQGNFDEMAPMLTTVLEAAPEEPDAWSLRGFAALQAGDVELAEESFSNAIAYRGYEFRPDRFNRALARIELEALEGAEEDINRLMARSPKDPGGNYLLGLLELQRENWQAAEAAFTLAHSQSTTAFPTAYYLALLQLRKSNLTQAEIFAEQFHTRLPEDAGGRKLLATIRLQQGANAEAASLVQPVLEETPDDAAARKILVSSLIGLGRFEEALALLRSEAEGEGAAPEEKIRLASTLLLSGDRAAGRRELKAILEVDPSYQEAEVLIILDHLNNEEMDEAVSAAEAYVARRSEDIDALKLLGQVYARAFRNVRARETFERVRELAPGDPTACRQLALLAIADQDFTLAKSLYMEILQHYPDNLSALVSLAELAAIQRDAEAMVTYLDQAIDKHPAELQPRLVLARHYVTRDDPDAALMALGNVAEAYPDNNELLSVMAYINTQQGNYAAAKYALQKLLQVFPDNPQTHFQLARAEFGLGNAAASVTELKKALQLEPDHFRARLALARAYQRLNNQTGFDEELAILVENRPDDVDVLELRAVQARRRGDNEAAVRYLEAAHEEGSSATTLLALATQYGDMGDRARAEALLSDWVESHPDALGARIALADLYLLSDRRKLAVEQYRAVVEQSPNSVMALNNLAWHSRNDDAKAALGYARRAVELAPQSPDALDTLAVVLLENRKFVEAGETIRKALSIRADDPQLMFHQAMIQEASGDSAAARRTLERLEERHPAYMDTPEVVSFREKASMQSGAGA